MVGGFLIVAYAGFGTSPRRGGSTTFVPAPQAYLLAAMLYGMSFIGMLALLVHRRASRFGIAVSVVYAIVAVCLTAVLSPG